MSRYFVGGNYESKWWHEWGSETTITVHEPEPSHPIKTGILDLHARHIYRIEDRLPIGFDLIRKPTT